MKKFMLSAFILSALLTLGNATPVMAQSLTGSSIVKPVTQQKIVLQNFFFKVFEIFKNIEKKHKEEALQKEKEEALQRSFYSLAERDSTSRGTERDSSSTGNDITPSAENSTVTQSQDAPVAQTPQAITPTATPKPTPIPTQKPTPKPTPKATTAPVVTATVAPSSQSIADKIIATGKQYLGVPYVWGASSPSGFDCSGFTSYVFKANGYTLPRTSSQQSKFGQAVSKDNLAPGDLVFFTTDGSGGPSHVGIYIGNGQFIHASSGAKKVTISSLSNSYYAQRYLNARRIIR